MRCPDCNKFVSYDTEVDAEEITALEVDSAGRLTGEFRRVLPCQECSQELKEYNFSVDELIEVPEGCEHEFDEVAVAAEVTSRTETKDRHGKPIKSARYMKMMYGINFSGKIECSKCNCSIDVEFEVEEQASAFEELV